MIPATMFCTRLLIEYSSSWVWSLVTVNLISGYSYEKFPIIVSILFLRSAILASLCLITAIHTALLPSERTSPVFLAGCCSTLAISFICITLSPVLNQMFAISSQVATLERNFTLYLYWPSWMVSEPRWMFDEFTIFSN